MKGLGTAATPEIGKKAAETDNWKRFEGLIEEEVSDTIFFVPERLRCHLWHYAIAKDLEDEEWEKKKPIQGMYTMKGYIYSDEWLWEPGSPCPLAVCLCFR